ncbi:MAG: hypothetical protein U1G05_17370 [Kiritimatiellia bacterium]
MQSTVDLPPQILEAGDAAAVTGAEAPVAENPREAPQAALRRGPSPSVARESAAPRKIAPIPPPPAGPPPLHGTPGRNLVPALLLAVLAAAGASRTS